MALIADDPGTTSRLERSGSGESRALAMHENETGLRVLAPPSRRHATRSARASKRSVPGSELAAAPRGAARARARWTLRPVRVLVFLAASSARRKTAPGTP